MPKEKIPMDTITEEPSSSQKQDTLVTSRAKRTRTPKGIPEDCIGVSDISAAEQELDEEVSASQRTGGQRNRKKLKKANEGAENDLTLSQSEIPPSQPAKTPNQPAKTPSQPAKQKREKKEKQGPTAKEIRKEKQKVADEEAKSIIKDILKKRGGAAARMPLGNQSQACTSKTSPAAPAKQGVTGTVKKPGLPKPKIPLHASKSAGPPGYLKKRLTTEADAPAKPASPPQKSTSPGSSRSPPAAQINSLKRPSPKNSQSEVPDKTRRIDINTNKTSAVKTAGTTISSVGSMSPEELADLMAKYPDHVRPATNEDMALLDDKARKKIEAMEKADGDFGTETAPDFSFASNNGTSGQGDGGATGGVAEAESSDDDDPNTLKGETYNNGDVTITRINGVDYVLVKNGATSVFVPIEVHEKSKKKLNKDEYGACTSSELSNDLAEDGEPGENNTGETEDTEPSAEGGLDDDEAMESEAAGAMEAEKADDLCSGIREDCSEMRSEILKAQAEIAIADPVFNLDTIVRLADAVNRLNIRIDRIEHEVVEVKVSHRRASTKTYMVSYMKDVKAKRMGREGQALKQLIKNKVYSREELYSYADQGYTAQALPPNENYNIFEEALYEVFGYDHVKMRSYLTDLLRNFKDQITGDALKRQQKYAEKKAVERLAKLAEEVRAELDAEGDD